jgi:glycosyltransferase involved in cell wall biosynthesis
MSQSLGVVVPAYQPDTDRLTAYVTALLDRLDPAVVRIELDTPSDRTVADLEALDGPVTVATTPYRRGKGAAITAGFEALETDILAFADADGSTPPASLARIVEQITEGRADVSVGSRRHPDARVTSHQTVARRLLGDGFAWLARTLLDADLHDFQCGAKAITRPAWQEVREHIYEAGFAWDIELIAMAVALELRVVEVPIEWEDKPGSTVEPVRTTLRLARALVTARHRAKQIRDSQLHNAIAARRDQPDALVERK